MDKHVPTRGEMLLKMSEEKQMEKIKRERAELLKATLKADHSVPISTSEEQKETEKKVRTNKEKRRRRKPMLKRRKKINKDRIKQAPEPEVEQNQANFIPPFQVPNLT